MPLKFKTYRFTIPAGEQVDQNIYADFIYCESASAEFQVETEGGDKFPISAGKQAKLESATTTFYFLNETGADINVELIAGTGDYKSDAVTGSVSVNNEKGTTRTNSTVAVTTAQTELTAADADRKQAIYYNDGSSTVYLIGDGEALADGIPLLPGEKFVDEVACGAAMYGIVSSGSEDVRVMEVA